jgi:hypothetical protein
MADMPINPNLRVAQNLLESVQRVRTSGLVLSTSTSNLTGVMGRTDRPLVGDVHNPPSRMRRFFDNVGHFFSEHGQIAGHALAEAGRTVGHAVSDAAVVVGGALRDAAVAGAKGAGKALLATGKAILHMTSMATAGVLLAGGAIIANSLAFAHRAIVGVLEGSGRVLQTLGKFLRHPMKTSRDVMQAARQGIRDLCDAVGHKYALWKQAGVVRDIAGQVLPEYRRGNVLHWLKSIVGAHTPVETGVTRGDMQSLSPEKQQEVRELAPFARMAYSGVRPPDRLLPEGYSLPKTDRLPKELRAFYNETNGLLEMPSGLKALVAEKEGKIVLSFAGTEPGLQLEGSDRGGSIQADYNQRFGLFSPMYKDALGVTQLMNSMKREDGSNISLELCGHSLGGGLAQFAATALGLKAFCYNSAGLSSSSLAILGQQRVTRAHDNIVNVRVDGDPVSSGGKLGELFKGMELGHVVTLPRPEGIGVLGAHGAKTVLQALGLNV